MTKTQPMSTMARRILRQRQGITMTQLDVWDGLSSEEQHHLIDKYGTEGKARVKFNGAIATLNSTDPNIQLVSIGKGGSSKYRWVQQPGEGPQKKGESHAFEFVGSTQDGTPLYRDRHGTIGLLEWNPFWFRCPPQRTVGAGSGSPAPTNFKEVSLR